MDNSAKKKLHFVMFPWFAFGHITPFLRLSNKLAQRGHKVSFLLSKKTSVQLQAQNLRPELITFYPLNVPAVNGLPPGAETVYDVPLISSHTHVATAFDSTRDQVEALVVKLAPDFIFHDFSYWLPELASSLGITTVKIEVSAASWLSQAFLPHARTPGTDYAFLDTEFGKGITFYDRIVSSIRGSDAICFNTCNEFDGEYVECFRKLWKKPVLLTGPGLPEEEADSSSSLDPKWDDWLSTFEARTVVFCTLGSQIVLEKPQFQELVLGFESTGLPFLVILKPPVGSCSVEEALPEGFEERVRGRGVVYGGWVQQSLILKHPSVGCFVSQCGFGSMWESLASDCQIVGLPFLPDQVVNVKVLAEDLRAAVAVERAENGWVSKERLCEAIKSVMDKEKSEFGREVRRNHLKFKDVLCKEGFISGYIDNFVEDLRHLRK